MKKQLPVFLLLLLLLSACGQHHMTAPFPLETKPLSGKTPEKQAQSGEEALLTEARAYRNVTMAWWLNERCEILNNEENRQFGRTLAQRTIVLRQQMASVMAIKDATTLAASITHLQQQARRDAYKRYPACTDAGTAFIQAQYAQLTAPPPEPPALDKERFLQSMLGKTFAKALAGLGRNEHCRMLSPAQFRTYMEDFELVSSSFRQQGLISRVPDAESRSKANEKLKPKCDTTDLALIQQGFDALKLLRQNVPDNATTRALSTATSVASNTPARKRKVLTTLPVPEISTTEYDDN